MACWSYSSGSPVSSPPAPDVTALGTTTSGDSRDSRDSDLSDSAWVSEDLGTVRTARTEVVRPGNCLVNGRVARSGGAMLVRRGTKDEDET